MSKKTENSGFCCQYCGCQVSPLTNGSCRNHCPDCLHSRHVDVDPGDRRSDCGGLMEPIRVIWKSGKGWQVVHRCQACGHTRPNRIAMDGRQPDNWATIVELSAVVSR